MSSKWFNVKTFTAAICLPMAMSIIGTSNSRASITTLERYYGVSSGTVAKYLTVNQIVSMFSPIFVSIFSRSHIPRILHVSYWIKASAFAVLIAPYFIGPKYEPTVLADVMTNVTRVEGLGEFCAFNSTDENGAATKVTALYNYRWFIPLGYLLYGFGGMLIWPLSISFIDSNAKPGQSGILLAVNFVITLCGPLIGYALSAFFLKLWVNINIECAPDIIDPRSSQWVGAWWMGFIIPLFGVVILNIPLGFFPRELKDKSAAVSKEEEAMSETSMMKKSEENEQSSWWSRMWLDTKKLGANPLFVSYTVAAVTSSWVMAVKATFGQKYLEMQFGLTPAEATQYKTYMMGSLVVGMMASGVVLKLAKFKAHGLAIFNTATHFAYLLLFLGLAFVSGCTPQAESDIFGLKGETFAQSDCHCDKVYNPVCLQDFTFNGTHYDQLTVINPCVAGCQSFTMDTEVETNEVFGCKMEKTSTKTRDYVDCANNVKSGVCGFDECKSKTDFYMAVLCLATFFGGLGGPSGTIWTLRCVEPELKAYSMSLVSLAMKLFGWLPAPILIGKLLDSLCLFEGDNDNCLFYSNEEARYKYFGVLTAVSTINIIFSLGCYFIFIRRLRSKLPMYGGMDTKVVMG